MDFITHLPTTSVGYDAIYSIVDHFSKWTVFIPMVGSSNAQQVAQLFFDYWVCQFGMPEKILSDCDAKLTGAFWRGLMSLLDCKVALSIAYHPQTDGQSERTHRTIE